MENPTIKKTHSLLIKGETTITGIKQVISLEEKEVKVSLGEKTLLLTGSAFNAEKLSVEEGILVLSGEVETVKYASAQEAKSIIKRLFK